MLKEEGDCDGSSISTDELIPPKSPLPTTTVTATDTAEPQDLQLINNNNDDDGNNFGSVYHHLQTQSKHEYKNTFDISPYKSIDKKENHTYNSFSIPDDNFSIASSSPIDEQRVRDIGFQFREALELGNDDTIDNIATAATLFANTTPSKNNASKDSESVPPNQMDLDHESGFSQPEPDKPLSDEQYEDGVGGIYTLRKRKEINYHPYTKLNWVRNDDITFDQRFRLDTSFLKEPIQKSPQRRRHNLDDSVTGVDNSTDEEYYQSYSYLDDSMYIESLSQPLTEENKAKIAKPASTQKRNQKGSTTDPL